MTSRWATDIKASAQGGGASRRGHPRPRSGEAAATPRGTGAVWGAFCVRGGVGTADRSGQRSEDPADRVTSASWLASDWRGFSAHGRIAGNRSRVAAKQLLQEDSS